MFQILGRENFTTLAFLKFTTYPLDISYEYGNLNVIFVQHQLFTRLAEVCYTMGDNIGLAKDGKTWQE